MPYEILFGIGAGAFGSAFLIISGIFLSKVLGGMVRPRVKVSEMNEGSRVELLGAVLPERDSIQGSHSGKQCVWLEETLEKEMHRKGADPTKWEVVKVHRKNVPFAITDGTDKIRVGLDHGDIKPKREFFSKGEKERLVEARIDVGDKVFAGGIVEKDEFGRKLLHLSHLGIGDRWRYFSKHILIASLFGLQGVILILISALFLVRGAA